LAGLLLTDEELQDLTLTEIEKYLQSNKRSLKEFKSMPYPSNFIPDFFGNRLIYEEKNYDPIVQKEIFEELFRSLTG